MTIDSVCQNLIIFLILLETDEVSVKIHCSDRRRSTTHTIIENQITLVRIGLYKVLYQFNWLLYPNHYGHSRIQAQTSDRTVHHFPHERSLLFLQSVQVCREHGLLLCAGL